MKLKEKSFLIADISNTNKSIMVPVKVNIKLKEGDMFIGDFKMINTKSSSYFQMISGFKMGISRPTSFVRLRGVLESENKFISNGRQYVVKMQNDYEPPMGNMSEIVGQIDCVNSPSEIKYSPYIKIISSRKVDDET